MVEVHQTVAISADAEPPHRSCIVLRDEDLVNVRRCVRLVALVRLEHA